jgi:hypothetical protein
MSDVKLFSPGKLVSTPAALKAIEEAGQDYLAIIGRHVSGDWGDLEIGDKAANERAMVEGDRIWSKYTLRTGEIVWVITEAEDDNAVRNSTCLLLPEEY